MHIATHALVCAVLAHGEHGAIVRLLTPDDGLQPGYVRGGRSQRLRPVLIPGNIVAADLRARSETQLASLSVELVQSRAGLFAEPLAAAAIEWACALTAATLPEGHPYPRLHSALDGLLIAIESAARARQWAAALVGYERLLIAELGYGAERTTPSAPAVAADEWPGLLAALRANGELLAGDLLPARAQRVLASRERLIDRLKRAAA